MLRGSRELRARLKAIKTVDRPIRKAWAAETARGARSTVRVRSGKTRASIREVGEHVEAGGGALFLEVGTKPHVIVPAKMSALKWNAAGMPRFAKRVRHPGSRRQPFIGQAGRRALDKVGSDVIVDTWNSAA